VRQDDGIVIRLHHSCGVCESIHVYDFPLDLS